MGRGTNLNHPPIPPRSAHFYQDPNPIEKQIDWPWVFAYAEQYVTEAGPETKSIMCAVAEVEWRKRAERWQKLYVAYQMPMIKRKEHQIFRHRGSRFKVEAGKAIINALEWRAWGAK